MDMITSKNHLGNLSHKETETDAQATCSGVFGMETKSISGIFSEYIAFPYNSSCNPILQGLR